MQTRTMSGIGCKGWKATAAPAAESQKKSRKRRNRQEQLLHKPADYDEAAEDAQAKQEMLNNISPSNPLVIADPWLLVLVH